MNSNNNSGKGKTWLLPTIEELAEFNIRWDDYEPSGGWLWWEHFVTSIDKELTDMRDLMDARRQKLKESSSARSSLAKEIARASSSLATIKRLADAIRAGGNGADAEIPEGVATWLADATPRLEALSGWNSRNIDDSGEVSALLKDFAFVSALRDFFWKDCELDMYLYSLSSIPPKFRAKIVRRVKHLCDEVMELRNVVDSSDSIVGAKLLECHIGKNYKTLSNAYDTIPASIRHMVKGVKDKGLAFWNESVIDWRKHTVDFKEGKVSVDGRTFTSRDIEKASRRG